LLRFSTAESSGTYYRRTFNSAVVIANFDRRIKWGLLPTTIRFGGRRRDFRPPNQVKPITDQHLIRRSSSLLSTAESSGTYCRRKFSSAVVIAIFDNRIERNVVLGADIWGTKQAGGETYLVPCHRPNAMCQWPGHMYLFELGFYCREAVYQY
jgi:hypothetical protein